MTEDWVSNLMWAVTSVIDEHNKHHAQAQGDSLVRLVPELLRP